VTSFVGSGVSVSWAWLIGIVGGTLAANVLGYLVVQPIAEWANKRYLRRMRIVSGLPPFSDKVWYRTLSGRPRCVTADEMQRVLTSVATSWYVLVDVATLAPLGMIVGAIGIPLLLVPLSSRGIPGAVAMLLACWAVMLWLDGGLLGWVQFGG